MKPALPLLAALASGSLAALVPALARACPYASAAGGCGSCGNASASLFSYGACLVLGLGLGIASVAFDRNRR